ncbi:MAG: tipN [Alphaproteobacteria bacterium]|nr:MAG: tipN [Alphaproteobacteria bacterium]
MKSRHRPPLNLSDPEPDAAATAARGNVVEEHNLHASGSGPTPDGDETAASVSMSSVSMSYDAKPLEPDASRPMSERRRRRLMEEQTTSTPARTEGPDPDSLFMPAFAVSSGQTPVAYTPPSTPTQDPVSPPPLPQASSGRGAPQTTYVMAGIASVLWISGIAAWVATEVAAGAIELEPLRAALFALIALAPSGLAFMLAHSAKEGGKLAVETRRAREMSDALLAPTALAARQAGTVLSGLRDDIDQAALASERARNDMVLLREALALETTRLNEAADSAGRTARRLAEALGRERETLQALGLQLDTQAAGVLDAVERQSRMVVDASDLAQTQLREAEAALAARAADLAAAATEAQDAARLAADDLARQTLRLENAGSGVAEQILSVEEGLGQQRAALVTAAYALRTDQEDFSAQVESQRAQLNEQLSAARSASGDLGHASQQSAETLRQLVEAATDQFHALVEMSQREADGFDAATKMALDRFETLAADARDGLMEETRRSLEALYATADTSRASAVEAAGQAQIRVDRLGEALFEAAQKADQAADTRIEDARRLIGETAGLVDEAGQRAADKLEATLQRMSDALSRVDSAISELDERSVRLPLEAQARADAVRVTVEEGLLALSAASRKAAEDTEALDAGFQDRVRRNYDMLTEAVRLMGVVSGEQTVPPRRRDVYPEPAPNPEASRSEPARAEPARTPAPREVKPPRDEDFGLRGRLRLEPASIEQGPSRDPRIEWDGLVDSGEEPEPLQQGTPEPAVDPAELAARITDAIRRMGVDPNALLPRSRVEEAATAFASRDPGHARQIVRRVAPAAVRSVSRRVMSDSELRSDVELYVRTFSETLARHARDRDEEAIQLALATDAGRAFMLLDAAVGDLG